MVVTEKITALSSQGSMVTGQGAKGKNSFKVNSFLM